MNQVVTWVKAHPRLTAWIVLAVGMNAMVVYEARSVGLLLGQWAALVVATTLVAGLCVWIIGWEDDEDDEPAAADAAAGGKPTPAASKPAEPTDPAATAASSTKNSS
jgi:hypothetical protein